MICILVLSITVLTGASGPTTMEDKLQLNYANHLVDTDSLKNGNVNPIGKVVVYDQDVNLKPLIAQSTLKYRQKLSDEQIEKRNKVINEYFSLVASGQEKLFTGAFCIIPFLTLRQQGLIPLNSL